MDNFESDNHEVVMIDNSSTTLRFVWITMYIAMQIPRGPSKQVCQAVCLVVISPFIMMIIMILKYHSLP